MDFLHANTVIGIETEKSKATVIFDGISVERPLNPQGLISMGDALNRLDHYDRPLTENLITGVLAAITSVEGGLPRDVCQKYKLSAYTKEVTHAIPGLLQIFPDFGE